MRGNPEQLDASDVILEPAAKLSRKARAIAIDKQPKNHFPPTGRNDRDLVFVHSKAMPDQDASNFAN
ncbi:hypothetical protein [Sphingobium nicotianae]|uniref:hypothetical protein n=1 Tax=Sphingobium nicotianae TaxID=2782607 RepID=UPI001BE4671D|nr:hypothetical protein [Sphingobium nicotianae]